MAVFKYVPEGMKSWVNQILDDIGGSGDTLKGASDKFKAQIDALMQPGVWTGSAAKANFDNFVTTHDAFVAFANSFMAEFQSSMTELNTQVGQLETDNLGSALDGLGEITKVDLSNFDAKTIDTDYVTYDYATIVSIGEELDSIRENLSVFKSNIDSHLARIGNGTEECWEGNAAASTYETLKSIVDTNMETINTDLNRCISNIKQAGENAQTADSGASA